MAGTDADREVLKHRLEQLPDHIRYHAKNGFSNLRDITAEQYEKFLAAYFAAAEGAGSLESEALAGVLGLDERQASDVVLACSLTAGAVTDLQVTADDFLDAARERVFEPAHEDAVRTLVGSLIGRRSALREAIERSSVANAILPTFQSSAVEIDLRLRFGDDGAVSGGTLVAIVGIRTDIEDDFYFQLSPEELRRLTKRLNEAVGRLHSSTSVLDRLVG
jgi:hypothetical protein